MAVAEDKDLIDSKRVNLESSPPLADECVTFTGTLASMVHREASALVETYGGRAVQSLSRAVTMLVVGEEGWPLEDNGAASQKLIHATELIAEGAEIRIVAESDWLHLIGLNERRDEIQRSYTPAMLSRLLDLPVGIIRRWARIGLIRAVRRVCRLPYFDYREVASAQRLAKLLEEGVTSEVLEKSLAQLSSTLVGTDRSLAQLNLLAQDEKVVLRDAHGMLNPRTGQRLLDFDTTDVPVTDVPVTVAPETGVPETGVHPVEMDEPRMVHPLATVPQPQEADSDCDDEMPISFSLVEARLRLGDRRMKDWSAEDWFQEGCRLSEEAAFESAANAFRNCLTLLSTDNLLSRDSGLFPNTQHLAVLPDPADVHFHLADALYRSGKPDAAIERYHCAIEFAPDFIEAWTQLGCLQAEARQFASAEEALLTAISIHDANPDALLHYAQLLDQMNRTDDATEYWKRYLQYDSRGPWADHARSRLDVEGMPTTAGNDSN